MKIRDIRGHIDCPTCGASKAMRITPDKNGDPFGFCEDGCGQQLRIGGDKRRVRDFIKRYPWAAGPGSEPAPKPEPVTAPKPEKIPVTVTVNKPEPIPGNDSHHGPVKKRSAFEDALASLGGKR
jgi:hypothetical protein